MLALKIISTIFVGLSCITTFVKNVSTFRDVKYNTFQNKPIFMATIYGWLWRALVSLQFG